MQAFRRVSIGHSQRLRSNRPQIWSVQVADPARGGIDYMHSKGVMHRDIKAENVLLTEWSTTAVVKIIDFGIAARRGSVSVCICICIFIYTETYIDRLTNRQ